MIFAGAIDIPTEVVFAILAALLLGAMLTVATGGLVACAVSGQRSTFWVGSLGFGAVALITADTVGGGGALLAGYVASAVIGGLHRRATAGPVASD